MKRGFSVAFNAERSPGDSSHTCPVGPAKCAGMQPKSGPSLGSGSVPFAGHYSLHFDAFHHPLGDTPPALPARTLRKVMY